MKKYLFFLMIFYLAISANSQDVIVKKDKTSIVSKVLEITGSEVKYKKFDNQDGPTYSLEKSEIVNIVYQNGEVEFFETSKTSNSCEIDLPDCGIVVFCRDLDKEITWDQANLQAPEGWRLPTLSELQCMCQYQNKLRLNRKDEYWSGTSRNNGHAYSVTLDDCIDENNSKNRTRAIRYVRDL